ncbi:MAG TPA: DUF4097 family beta strand repeat-containing protein [Candidatus Limnocylindrales bacterium]|nr:DUF4097 family beta strand repeat-containing protein [Candidatus Limnocylindrales bacterium]
MTAATVAPAVREIPFDATGTVRVVLASGSVRIRGIDEPVVRVRSLDGKPVEPLLDLGDAPRSISVGAHGGADHLLSLVIGGLRLGTSGGRELDLEVPRRATVQVRTASADVEATELNGTTAWTTASGDVRLAIASGQVSLQTVSGDAELVAGSPVRVEARSVSGDLRLRAPHVVAARLSTTSGDILVEGELGAGPHEIDTVSGDVRIATGAPVRVETRTITGAVRSDVDHRFEGGRGIGASGVLIVGTGTVPVRWRSMSGDLRLVAPEPPIVPELPPVPDAPPIPPIAPEPPARPAPAAPSPAYGIVAEARASANPSGQPRRLRTEEQDAARLEILRALERGEVSIDEANIRLQAVDDAGPLHRAGWV